MGDSPDEMHVLLEEILADRERGASEIEARLLAVLAGSGEGGWGPEADLERLARGMLAFQPAMGNLDPGEVAALAAALPVSRRLGGEAR